MYGFNLFTVKYQETWRKSVLGPHTRGGKGPVAPHQGKFCSFDGLRGIISKRPNIFALVQRAILLKGGPSKIFFHIDIAKEPRGILDFAPPHQ